MISTCGPHPSVKVPFPQSPQLLPVVQVHYVKGKHETFI